MAKLSNMRCTHKEVGTKGKRELKWCPLRHNLCMKEGCAWWVSDSEECSIQQLARLQDLRNVWKQRNIDSEGRST